MHGWPNAIHGAASLASGMKRRIASKAASALAGAPSPVEASEATTARPSVPASTLAVLSPPHATPDATVIARTENADQIGSLTIERPFGESLGTSGSRRSTDPPGAAAIRAGATSRQEHTAPRW